MSGFDERHAARAAEAEQLFTDNEIVLADDHFVYAAGGHGDAYVRKDVVLTESGLFVRTSDLMAEDLTDAIGEDGVREIDLLVGIAPCSSQYAQRMSESLGKFAGHAPKVIFLEKVPRIEMEEATGEAKIVEDLRFKRGYDLLAKGKVLHFVEDVVNSGMSLLQAKDEARKIEGAEIHGASAVYCRTPERVTKESLGLGLWLPLVEKTLTNYAPGECPMDDDLENHPINTKYGKGEKWLAERR